jgi:O-Antigen ligase
MSSDAVSSSRSHSASVRHPRSTKLDSAGAQLAVLGVGAAAFAGYLLANGSKLLAAAFILLPVVAWLLSTPSVLLVGLGASIPALGLTGSLGSLYVSVTDILLVLTGAAILIGAVLARRAPSVRALRPVALPVAQYTAVVAMLLVAHFGTGEVVQTGQRYELFLLPLLVGSYAALKNQHMRVLQAYVVASTLLAIVWPLHSLGMQKNPAGQFIANAILLVIAVRALRRFVPCLAILVPGLFLTESRGAIAAAAIGIAVIIAIQGFRSRSVSTRVLLLALVAVGAFLLMPSALRDRVTTFSAGVNTPAEYSLQIRQELGDDARRIIDRHPWSGVGVGNYLTASTSRGTPADDPHQILLLQAAEGGYGLAASFVVLILGSSLALWKMRHLDIAPAAAGVLIATAVHGLVDVYWVRGTPILGWLLVGMACGALLRERQDRFAE